MSGLKRLSCLDPKKADTAALPRSLLTGTFHDPLWKYVGAASPNHNTANRALELAGWEGLGGIPHLSQGQDPGCALSAEWTQLQSLDTLVLPLAQDEVSPARGFPRVGSHPDCGSSGTQTRLVNLDFFPHKTNSCSSPSPRQDTGCRRELSAWRAHKWPWRPPHLAGFLGPDSPPALTLSCCVRAAQVVVECSGKREGRRGLSQEIPRKNDVRGGCWRSPVLPSVVICSKPGMEGAGSPLNCSSPSATWPSSTLSAACRAASGPSSEANDLL